MNGEAQKKREMRKLCKTIVCSRRRRLNKGDDFCAVLCVAIRIWKKTFFASKSLISWHEIIVFRLFALRTWFLERNNFTYGSHRNDLNVVGHYTQMVWAASHKVGCGLAKCASGGPKNKPFFNYVCNYCPMWVVSSNHLCSGRQISLKLNENLLKHVAKSFAALVKAFYIIDHFQQ